MSRYTLLVRADRKDQVEAVLAKLPSHHEMANVDGVEQLVPVGRLATLVPYVKVEGDVPAWYVCSGEFNDGQFALLKAAIAGTKLAKGVTWHEADGELAKDTLLKTVEAI